MGLTWRSTVFWPKCCTVALTLSEFTVAEGLDELSPCEGIQQADRHHAALITCHLCLTRLKEAEVFFRARSHFRHAVVKRHRIKVKVATCAFPCICLQAKCEELFFEALSAGPRINSGFVHQNSVSSQGLDDAHAVGHFLTSGPAR